MNVCVYAIYDKKALVYNVPFFLANNMVAVRTFMGIVQDETTMVSKNPEDFVLYRLADYDDEKGLITSLENNMQVMSGMEAIRQLKYLEEKEEYDDEHED